jgi:hypothetical protein
MKRTLIVGAVAVLAMGLAAAAYAATQKDFGGPIKGGGTMSLAGSKSGGKFTKAGEFVVNKIPLKCNQGNTRGTFSTSNFTNVSSQRKFSYTMNLDPGETVKINGKFNSAGNKATGVVRVSGVNFTTHTNCTTNGARDWKTETY